MESQPQNPEFRNIPENFQPCICCILKLLLSLCSNFIRQQTHISSGSSLFAKVPVKGFLAYNSLKHKLKLR